MPTYYIDTTSGNDSNSGLSQGAAWKTLPGTRNAANTAFVSAAWGAITTSNKIPVGTVFKIMSGSNFNSTFAGHILIDPQYYTDTTVTSHGEALSIERDETWGSGAVVFDGASCISSANNTGGHFECRINGVSFDGKTSNGINIRNGTKSGIYWRERVDNTRMNWCRVMNVKFFNNGTINVDDNDGASTGGIRLRKCKDVYISNCIFDGDGNWLCGIVTGDSGNNADPQWCCENATIVDCEAYGHVGGVLDDSGIGFKNMNPVNVTYLRCVSHDNLKGWDNGEQHPGSGTNVYDPSIFISAKIINCEAYNCTWGMSANGAKASVPNTIKFWFINCIIRDISFHGGNVYSGPLEVAYVHCVFANIGTGAYNGSGEDCALNVQNDNTTDFWQVTCHVYNCIVFAMRDCPWVTLYDTNYSGGGGLTWDFDYVTYVQDTAASARWCQWSYSNVPAGTLRQFTWAEAVGAGTAWATTYGKDATVPTSPGTGHFGCDINSYKILGGDAERATFWADAVNFVPSVNRLGLNLTSKPWYVPEIGIDRNGNPRTTWRNGLYDVAVIPPPPSGVTKNQNQYWWWGPS